MGGKDRNSDTRKGGPTPEDRNLWKEVMRDAKPLRKKGRRANLPEEEERPAGTSSRKADPRSAPRAPAKAPTRTPPAKPAPAPLAHGSSAGVDKRKAARFRRGKLEIEATLDLHGMMRAEAQRALDRFLERCEGQGKRCVLVITGKGLSKDEGGVLRQEVPRWLNEPENRDRVLSFDYAQQRHGGMGALYVLLKRRRDPR